VASRIDWAPDDRALVSCIAGAVRIHDLSGRASPRARVKIYTREVAAARVLDARWRADGNVLGIDDRGMLVWNAVGELVAQRHMLDERRAVFAAIAAGGTHFVSIAPARNRVPSSSAVYITAVAGEREWTLNPNAHDVAVWEGRAQAALSGDAKVVAIGYQTQGRRHEFIAIEVESDLMLDRGSVRAGGTPPASGPVMVALDEHGERLALAAPGTGDQMGVIRLGRGAEDYERSHPSGAHALALDATGNLAAFGYAATPDGARGRLRVEYLDHASTTSATVGVLDTLSIDPALPDIVALAFSRDSRCLACLASTGEIEIVPVP
jgi:hypothetical protein